MRIWSRYKYIAPLAGFLHASRQFWIIVETMSLRWSGRSAFVWLGIVYSGRTWPAIPPLSVRNFQTVFWRETEEISEVFRDDNSTDVTGKRETGVQRVAVRFLRKNDNRWRWPASLGEDSIYRAND